MTNVETLLQETEDIITKLGWDPDGDEARALRQATEQTMAYQAAVFADAVEDLVRAWTELPPKAKRIVSALAKGVWK